MTACEHRLAPATQSSAHVVQCVDCGTLIHDALASPGWWMFPNLPAAARSILDRQFYDDGYNGGVTILAGTQGEWVKEVWTSDHGINRPVWHDDASPIEIPWP